MKLNRLYTQCILFLAFSFSLFLLSSGDSLAAGVDGVISGHGTCDNCHGRYPGASDAAKGKNAPPARIPADKVDVLCLGCHGPAGIAMSKASTHGAQNYVMDPIGCIDCHDPHDNAANYVGGHNIKMIGNANKFKMIGSANKFKRIGNANKLKLIGGANKSGLATIKTPNSGDKFVVFESRGADTGESPLYSFADGDMDNDGIYSGICEVCHTRTKFHNNTQKGDHGHYSDRTCTNCHVHVNQFLAFRDSPIAEPEISGIIVDESGDPWEGITVFIDINGNGKYDAGEPTATSDANGKFTFKGVPNKGYAILLMPGSLPNGYRVKISMVNNVVLMTLIADEMLYPTRLSWKTDGGYIVADFLINAVYFYDGGDKLINKLSGMAKPLGLAIDNAGRIYVGNEGRRNVEVYNASGGLMQIFANGQIGKPNDIALDRDQRVYVVDSQGKNVRVFNADGTNAFTISKAKDGAGFLFPLTLAVQYRMDNGTETGELYVADKNSCFVHVYDLQGNYLRSLGGKFAVSGMKMPGPYGTGNVTVTSDKFNSIQSIAFDQKGRLHVLDSYMSVVNILDPVTGAGLGAYDTFPAGKGSQLPLDIDINASGQVIMSSFKTRSVQRIYTVQ